MQRRGYAGKYRIQRAPGEFQTASRYRFCTEIFPVFSTADTFAHFADHCKCECLNYKSSEFLEFFQNTEHYLIFLTLLIHRVSNFQLTQAFPDSRVMPRARFSRSGFGDEIKHIPAWPCESPRTRMNVTHPCDRAQRGRNYSCATNRRLKKKKKTSRN